jgi:hypothetical protein
MAPENSFSSSVSHRVAFRLDARPLQHEPSASFEEHHRLDAQRPLFRSNGAQIRRDHHSKNRALSLSTVLAAVKIQFVVSLSSAKNFRDALPHPKLVCYKSRTVAHSLRPYAHKRTQQNFKA